MTGKPSSDCGVRSADFGIRSGNQRTKPLGEGVNEGELVQGVDSVVKYDYNYGHEKRRAT